MKCLYCENKIGLFDIESRKMKIQLHKLCFNEMMYKTAWKINKAFEDEVIYFKFLAVVNNSASQAYALHKTNGVQFKKTFEDLVDGFITFKQNKIKDE